MIGMAGATGRSSASRPRRTVPGQWDAGPGPVSTAMRGRVVRVLAATVVAVLATALAVGPAGPAAAFRATCHEVDVPVTVAGRPAIMHGTLCLPHRRTNTVVVLVPGSTYNHVYWDFPLRPERYSFRRGLNQQGLATFVVDRLGTGLSSRPPSTEVTAQAQAAGIHARPAALPKRLARVVALNTQGRRGRADSTRHSSPLRSKRSHQRGWRPRSSG